MNEYITGSTIKKLREEKKLTQNKLASLLNVSDKTISKWETGKGYPDIEMLEPLAKALGVSTLELLNGNTISNSNVSANLLKSNFYVCPICGNVIASIGESLVLCHGITLPPLEKEEDNGLLKIEKIENEYYVTLDHEMSKTNYVSFIAAVSSDNIQIKKLYPESNPEAYFRIAGVKYIYYYSNIDGLFYKRV